MKILLLGKNSADYKLGYFGFDKAEFFSDHLLLDADILIWDIEKTIEEVTIFETHYQGGEKALKTDAYDYVNYYLESREKELKEFIDSGRVLFVEIPTYGEYSTSHFSSKNNTDTPVKIDFFKLLPINLKITPKMGSNFEFAPKIQTTTLLENSGRRLKYYSVIEQSDGIPLLRIKGTKYVVGQCIVKGRGQIFLMPKFKAVHSEDTAIYLQELIKLSSIFIRPDQKQSTPVPSWVNQYVLPKEVQDRDELEKLYSQLNILNSKIEQQKTVLQEYSNLKVLIYGTGKELESGIKKVFLELGVTLEEPLPDRDDLIIHYKEKIAVIECKGVTGSAAEKHAAQLMKWVNNYHTEKDLEPKGILVVNTFKEKPLNDRNERDFPDQMLPYCTRQGFCLLTGKQLLNLYLACKADKASADDIINMLFETVGVLNSGVNLIELAK